MDVMVILPLILLNILLIVIALLDVTRRHSSRIRGEMKWPWVLVILFVSTLGPIIYFVIGRKN